MERPLDDSERSKDTESDTPDVERPSSDSEPSQETGFEPRAPRQTPTDAERPQDAEYSWRAVPQPSPGPEQARDTAYGSRASEQPALVSEQPAVDDFEPGVHLSVADGFRFGCGFVLALIGFHFAVVVIVALVLAAAGIVGAPISLGSLFGGN